MATTVYCHLLVADSSIDPNALKDIVSGYIDGLMQINIRSQLDQCGNVIPNAEITFLRALDGFKECNDFWMPLSNKAAKI